MNGSRVHFLWQKHPAAEFRTGVSLHSHTLLSRESLEFIQRTIDGLPWVSGALRRQQDCFRRVKGLNLNMARGWWTPLLSPRQAFDVEASQIENSLGMRPLVSISDHDDLSAGMQLRAVGLAPDIPVSVEWTVPFRTTFFHLGVHNIRPDHATVILKLMQTLTASPDAPGVADVLAWLAECPQTLVVFNHPAWDENHIGTDEHWRHVDAFLQEYGGFIHAIELNGLRDWQENRTAALLAEKAGLPIVSGGDRHGREPNACLNVTNARTFAEFAAEIRDDGRSEVVFMPQYRDSLRLRLFENMADILRDYPGHAMGWTHWSDRVFCETDEGPQSLAALWGGPFPSVVNHFAHAMGILNLRRVRSALRYALTESIDYVL